MTPPNPAIQQMMQMAQTQMQNPASQPVPQGGGIIDPAHHPVIAQILKTISDAAAAYGWADMPPEQRLQSQALSQQKAEAMARMAAQQQQLGYEGQRTQADVAEKGARTANIQAETPYVGPRAAADVALKQAQTANIPKETAIKQQAANTEQKRADQEYKIRQQEQTRLEEQFKQEYGPQGLKAQALGIERKKVGVEEARVGVEDRANDIRDKAIETELNYRMASLKAQGLQTDRAAIEDARKAAYKAADDSIDKFSYSWAHSADAIAQKKADAHAQIDQKMDAQLAQAEKTAGTGGMTPVGGDTVTIISNGQRGTIPRANLAEAQKRDPRLQVVQ